jgi:hypothetical protein
MNNPVDAELARLSKETLIELVKMYSRNWLTCDGLWFSGVEEHYGTDAALEIDIGMWKVQSKVEARRLKEILAIPEGGGIDAVLRAIVLMSWSPGFGGYEIARTETKAILTCRHCPPQEARIRRGVGVFACRPTFENGFRNVAHIIDPRVRVECKICPPGPRPPGIWCQWEFRLVPDN